MGRIYTVNYTGTITAAGTDTDLLSIQPADDKPIKLRGFSLGQTSEVGDSQEESVNVTVKRLPATFTVGSGGSAVTPSPPDSASSAAGCTTRCNDTTVSTTSGSAVTLDNLAWNIRNTPYEHWYPDDNFCPKAKQGEGLVVRLETTLADDISGCFTFWIEEE